MSDEIAVTPAAPTTKLKWTKDDDAPVVMPRPRLARVDRLEEKRTVWTCKSPSSDAEDLLRHDFWRLVSHRLNRHDVIFVIADDETWEVECRVEASSPDGAEVSVIRKYKRKSYTDRQTVLGDGAFVTRYQNGGWCVLRIKDQHAVVAGYQSESAAIVAWGREQPRRG